MTEEEYGEIVDADVAGDKIIYTAHSNGRTMMGELPQEISPYTVLSDDAMEELAEQVVGMEIEWPDL